MKEPGLYAGLLERIWPGLRLGLATYVFGVAAYYGLGCATGMNARFGRSLADPSDDLWGAQHCLYAAGITFTTIGYTDLLGTDAVRIYRHPATGRHYAYNSAAGLVPEPGAPPEEVGRLVLEHDYSLLTTLGTVVLALVGMGVFVYSISAVTAFFVEGGHLELREMRRMAKQVARRRGHVVVCGAGPTGLHAVERLLSEGTPLVVLERVPEALGRLRERFPAALWIRGDPTEVEALHAAGLGRARGLVATLADDNDNLVVLVTARQENPSLRMVSRAESREAAGRLHRAGAAEVVPASFMGGLRMASEAIRPTVVRFLDGFLGHEEDLRGFRFTGLRVEPGSPQAGKTLGQSRFLEETGLRVLALRYAGRKDFRYNPGPDAMLEAGVEVSVLADGPGLERARAFLGSGEKS